ncbi:flp pilus-assembly TadE/G-like family protein [Nocardiopsis sp. EMB25]|uniref:Rv3654c family TadE-like protein n=1 Tax=Nocardiopsis sp. EMB25 TaxID=2835867 RepID=UPI00228396D5|nr:Rv3654c family TadE-like protein [Nocardiopsis sp. EMB25]MCY9786457.1 flp pilus-assembly TadE/G-like family protein [Nocardiopsis sp. EMB25]
MRVTHDTGSATVWTVGVCALLWLAVLTVLLTAAARLDRDRAATAADLAALAAAAGAVDGTDRSCDRGRAVAEANGGALVSCVVTGLTVEVAVSVPSSVLERTVTARARAGPVRPYPADLWDTDTRAHSRTPR